MLGCFLVLFCRNVSIVTAKAVEHGGNKCRHPFYLRIKRVELC